jgi:hypothetical protein
MDIFKTKSLALHEFCSILRVVLHACVQLYKMVLTRASKRRKPIPIHQGPRASYLRAAILKGVDDMLLKKISHVQGQSSNLILSKRSLSKHGSSGLNTPDHSHERGRRKRAYRS